MSERDYYAKAVEIVMTERKCSISLIQRRLGIAYNEAARLVERMETEGIVSTPDFSGKRSVQI